MRRRLGRGDGQGAAVTVVQRFGGSLNLNVHLHSLVVDGLYVRGAAGEKPLFIPVPEPEPEELQMIVERVGDRVIDLLLRRGVIKAGDSEDEAPQPAQEPAALERLQAASIQGLLAFSPTLKGVGMLGRDLFSRPAPRWGSGVPEYEGFTLHAAVRIEADDRDGLERVCRYVLRPAFATDRFEQMADGRIVYKMRRAWADGTSHVVLDPLELIGKLAALVPQPRQHQIHYHGIFGPNAKWRAQVVAECPEGGTCRKRGRGRCRMDWAELMKRTFKIDVLKCPECGGRMKLIALIGEDQLDVVRKILKSMGLPQDPPARAPARSPPQMELPHDGAA